MIVTNTTPPSQQTPFSDVPGNTVFVRGPSNIAYVKTADGQALRLADSVLDGSVQPTDGVIIAENATIDVFPSP